MDEQGPQCDVVGVPKEPIFKGDYSFNTGIVPKLDGFDFSIVIVVIGVILGITLHVAWKHRKRASIDDYLLAGRDIGWILAGSSLTAGFFSAITVIGFPRLMYTDSSMEGWNFIGVMIGSSLAASLFIPVYRNLGITSTYEYLEHRFSRKVRTIGSIYFIIMTLVYMSMVLYAPGISISSVVDVPLWTSIIAVGLLCVTYTTIGGMRAVIFTDTFLLIVMMIGMLCVLIKGLLVIGGFDAMWTSGRRSSRIIFEYSMNPKEDESFQAILVSGIMYAFTAFSVNQLNVHRVLCCRTNSDASKSFYYVAIPCSIYMIWVSALFGLVLSAFYENCDPVQAGIISDAKQIAPLFVMDTMSGVIGLPGLFIAGVLSATLSTISSGLNSIATVTLEDFFRLYMWNHIGEGRARRMTQILTVLFGTVCLELTFMASKMKGALFQIDQAVNGALGAPLLCVFCMGVFFPWVNSKGALWSLLGGALFNFMMMGLRAGLTAQDTSTPATPCISNCNLTVLSETAQTYLRHPTTPAPLKESDSNILDAVSKRYSSAIGFFVTMAIGLLVTKCTGQPHEPTDPALIVPLFDTLFPLYYLPESIKQKFRFGIDHTDKWEKWYAKQKELAQSKMEQLNAEEPEEPEEPTADGVVLVLGQKEPSVVSNKSNETYV